ncbi:MAG: hypothetical protein KH208_05815 [Desulfovibrio sp.]|uniref:hypothetical protein n=1 Tax=Desulfovibrio sp. TaxID=885 RepID=UPI0025C62BF5|nr:hypothetical protein [Desulfovibrio sp.]MBS6829376.1 hypothetical protein [Desulfovibrio sp.]
MSRTDKDSSQAHESLSGEIAVAIRKPLCGNGYRIEHTARSIFFCNAAARKKAALQQALLMRAEPGYFALEITA